MTRCILIGIGGSGAKSVEAFVHLAAAGLGPRRVCLGLVDQDKSNGNTTRTTKLIQNYVSLRSTLRGDQHHVGASSSLFGADLDFIPDIWAPVSEDGAKLSDIFGALPNDQRDLLEALFSSAERDMILDQGFRGHPAVGAVAMEVRLAQEGAGEFWDRIAAEIAQAEFGEHVVVFVVGSIFGGTGASGFPTISRELRRRIRGGGKNLTVRIGGALLLPYFRVLTPAAALASKQPIVPPTQFLRQAQAALKYYRDLPWGINTRIWDKLFVLGWDPLLELPSFSTGGGAQSNPSLLPELYAALAAHEFFDEKITQTDGVVRIDREHSNKLEWADLPNNSRLREQLGQFLRFALTFRSIYGPIVRARRTRFEAQAWHQQLVASRLNGLDDNAREQLVDAITAYCTKFLGWISTSVFRGEASGDGTRGVRLVRARHFALEKEIQDQQAKLKDGIDAQAIAEFAEVVEPSGGPTLDHIFRNLSYASPAKDQLGFGIFCAQLHTMCDGRSRAGTEHQEDQ